MVKIFIILGLILINSTLAYCEGGKGHKLLWYLTIIEFDVGLIT